MTVATRREYYELLARSAPTEPLSEEEIQKIADSYAENPPRHDQDYCPPGQGLTREEIGKISLNPESPLPTIQRKKVGPTIEQARDILAQAVNFKFKLPKINIRDWDK